MPKYECRTCAKHGEVQFVLESRGYWRCCKCRSEGVIRWRHRVKERLVAACGGKCQGCGYDRCMRALEFHHRNPEQKEFGIAAGGRTKGFATKLKEAKKCVLLCSNCHMEVEAGLRSIER